MILSASSLPSGLRIALFLLSIASFPAMAEDSAPLEGEAFRLADLAYRELTAGHNEAAEKAVRKALQLRPDSLQLGLLLMDVYQRKGELDAAVQQADTMLQQFPNNPQVLLQRGYLKQRQQWHQAAMEDFYVALSQEGLNAEQQRSARLAWADSAAATKQYGVVLDALAPYAGEPDASVQLRRAYAYAGMKNSEQAHEAAGMAKNGSKEQMEAARQLFEQTAPDYLSQAYAALNNKDDRTALAAFQHAFAAKPGTAAQYSDAAYAAKRLGENRIAIALFKQALDANAGMPADKKSFDAPLEFGYRRGIQEMDRNFGAVANLSYQSNFAPQSSINVLQGGLEAYWQPENAGYKNGKLFQAFARSYETLYDRNGGATGSQTAQGSVGARYKPVGDMNVVLTAERLFRIGNLTSNDWLFRVGYSTGEGTDIQPYNHDWQTWQFYTEGAYFQKATRYIQSMETRYGHSWRMDQIDSRMVMTPHLALIGNYDNRATLPTAVSVGPGVSVRYWFRDDTYHAPPSWLEFNLQYMKELSNTRRLQGLILNTILWY